MTTRSTTPKTAPYGADLGAEIAQYARTIEQEIDDLGDARFAVRVEIRTTFASNKEVADVELFKAAEAPLKAAAIEKPSDPERTHPHRTAQLLERVRQRLAPAAFSSHDLQAVLAKEKWKRGDNVYHRLQRNPDTPKYSDGAVDAICRLVQADGGYLTRARESYAAAQRARRTTARRATQ